MNSLWPFEYINCILFIIKSFVDDQIGYSWKYRYFRTLKIVITFKCQQRKKIIQKDKKT